MVDRPIIMSGPMVRAILDGRKTQTRRVLREQPQEPPCEGAYLDSYCSEARTAENHRGMSTDWCWWTPDNRVGCCITVPYVPGDRIWVKETWHPDPGPPTYRADVPGKAEGWGWRSPRYMPRRLSRLTLTVTDVRVQRVQEISEDDAEAEGARPAFSYPGWDGVSTVPQCRWGFHELWDSLNGKRGHGWDKNPWIVAVTFTAERRNIDA